MQPKLPLTFGPRYRVVTEIAAGGMGSVYLALRLDADGSKHPVAIKQLHPHLADDPEIVACFLDEARIASRIVHANVVRVEDVEMVGDELVIVIEYVEGVALSQVLKTVRSRGDLLPVPVVRRVLHDALLGLEAAHALCDERGASLGVVHRDVSPHNLLVGADGVTRVGDFGIATATGRIASTRTGGGVKGKLQYLSPEQVYRKPLDRRADIFAAGTVLWECLTGKRLFSAGTEGETLAMVLREPIAPPSTHRMEVPLELDETCLRALERDPERRWPSAKDLADAIAGGEMASRSEVAAIVAEAAPTTFAARRSVLEEALRKRGMWSAGDTGSATAVESAAGAPSSSSRVPMVAALLLGLVAGGVGVGVAARRASPDAVQAAPPAPSVAPLAPSFAAAAVDAPRASAPAPASADASPPVTPAAKKPKVAASPTSTARAAKKPASSPSRPFMPSDL